jgi:hypothetical protein
MIRRIVIISCIFISIVLISCNLYSGSETFDFDRDTPAWLKAKLDSISNFADHYYDWTRVYRYDWNESFVYHFSVPLSSCIYCELYDHDGNKVTAIKDSLLQDILKTRNGEVLIWENKK